MFFIKNCEVLSSRFISKIKQLILCVLKDLVFYLSEVQIKEGTEDNSKIIFLISQENIWCDPSLEPSL